MAGTSQDAAKLRFSRGVGRAGSGTRLASARPGARPLDMESEGEGPESLPWLPSCDPLPESLL